MLLLSQALDSAVGRAALSRFTTRNGYKMKIKPLLIAAACLGTPFAGVAGQAHVCHSSTMKIDLSKGPGSHELSDSVVFNCPDAGSKTIPALAQDGWKIVSVTEQGGPDDDPDVTNLYFELVIQKD
ncbi:hypothetical protein [Candidatus Sodalis sp. SoCistrobi]|uniref:hypothetical protein n=1 Tax=Candidatus Sodalis sp. SoCistrobi TaxID=1922216 RepID=UPI0020B8A6DF|nr:hypothetical protein [Candidatus Sodalis sp. SoCistrobi]